MYDACIIGAGIGGLAAALSLQQAGLKVLVIERDESYEDRKQGYGLTLTNSSSGPLAKLGLLDECIQKNTPSHCHFTFDSYGNVLGYYGRKIKDLYCSAKPSYMHKPGQGGNIGNLRIPRQDLRLMMINRLSEGTVRWGCKFVKYEEIDDRIRLYVEKMHSSPLSDQENTLSSNIEAIDSSVLIGADGIRSRIRQLYEPTSTLHFLGVSVILGISQLKEPNSDPLLQNQGYYVLNGHHRLFTMPFDNKKHLVMWQLSFPTKREEELLVLKHSPCRDILSYAQQMVESWFPQVSNLLAHSLVEETWCTPLYDREALDLKTIYKDHTKLSRVTVLGDAAHPMSMFKGQGANQALEDAPNLTDILVGHFRKRKRDATNTANTKDNEANAMSLSQIPLRSIHNLLRRFEREMIARTEKKVLASRAAAEYLHSELIFRHLPLSQLYPDYYKTNAEDWNKSENNDRSEEKEDASKTVKNEQLVMDERWDEELWMISGVETKDYAEFIQSLAAHNINARSCGDVLEDKLVEVKTLMDNSSNRTT